MKKLQSEEVITDPVKEQSSNGLMEGMEGFWQTRFSFEPSNVIGDFQPHGEQLAAAGADESSAGLRGYREDSCLDISRHSVSDQNQAIPAQWNQ